MSVYHHKLACKVLRYAVKKLLRNEAFSPCAEFAVTVVRSELQPNIRRLTLAPSVAEAEGMKREIFYSILALCLSIRGEGSQPAIAVREAMCRTEVAHTAHLAVGDFRKLQTLVQLGEVLRDERKFRESEALYRQALSESTAAFGEDSFNTAAIENNLSNLLQRCGRYSEAERLLQHSAATYESAVGKQNIQLAIVLNDLAVVYLAEHRYNEAEPVLDRALQILEAFQPLEAVELSDILNDLAFLKQRTGKRLEADALYKRSIDILERTVHGDDPRLAVLWANRALLLSDLHDYEPADALYRRSLDAFERLFGSGSPRLRDVLKQYAILLRKMHRKGEARQMELRIAQINSKTPDSRTSEMTIDVRALQPQARFPVNPPLQSQSGSRQSTR